MTENKLEDKMAKKEETKESKGIRFLYPTSRQFPVDEVCSAIVRELEKRNWNIPGIKVEFHEYGTGERKARHVKCVKGNDFKIYFCRVQGSLGGGLNDVAAVTEITIPKKQICLFEDESGPTYYIYVGKNWKSDCEWFMSGSKVNSKLHNEPRRYLRFGGGWKRPKESGYQFTRIHERAPYLVHTNDLGREYDPVSGEPDWFRTMDVLNEFTAWIENNVLGLIMSQPIPDEKIDIFAPKADLPFPEGFENLFCFCENRDLDRIKQGKENLENLPLEDRYGLLGGYRLLAWDIPDDGTIPKIAYEGFIWCELGKPLASDDVKKLAINGGYRSRGRGEFIVRIKPKNANNVYIADFFGQKQYREAIFNREPKPERLSEKQYQEFERIPARTIIPINEYKKGSFMEPVILIERELSLDEVEIVA